MHRSDHRVSAKPRAPRGPVVETIVFVLGWVLAAVCVLAVSGAEPSRAEGSTWSSRDGGTTNVPAPASAAAEKAALAAFTASLDSLSRAGAFSGAVLLARDGKPLLRRAYGLADREAKRANQPDTKFNLGSINKIFTRVAVEQLAERGKIGLDETIDHYLPDYPKAKGSAITVRMLLEHRGGTGDIFHARFAEARDRLRTMRDWYLHVRDQDLEFEPGSRRAYSNAGYVLLGAIVAAVSGEDYYDYVREHVFRPARMTATDSYAAAAKTPTRAVGYTRATSDGDDAERGTAPLHPNTDFLPARGSSAGGGYSTVDDMLRFAGALSGGKLLGPEGTAAFAGPDAGLGVAGGAPGVNAVLEMMGPYTLVVMANLDPPAAEDAARIGREWMARLLGARIEVEGGDGDAIRPDGPSGPGGPDGPGAVGSRAVVRGAGPHDPLARPTRTFLPREGIDVPMTLTGHLPSVEVMVNGKGPFRFAIDTGGAGAARLDAALAKKLGLEVVGEVWGGDPSGKNRRRMEVVGVDSIQLGGATFVRLDASTRDDDEGGRPLDVDGVLGFGLFSGSMVTLDYPAGRLRVEPKELPPADGADVLDYDDADGIPSIAIAVDSLRMSAHVDAGSMGGFVLPERLLEKLPLAAAPRVVGTARTVSNTFEIKAAPLRGSVRIGTLDFERPNVEFQPIMPDANVGSRILRDLKVSFDTKNKRIRFQRAS